MSSGKTSKELQINLKMREVSENRVYEFENFRLDASHLLLFRNGEQINLTPKVVETLLVLVERAGEIISKDELMNAVWPETSVEESNLSQNLYLLRKALGTRADGQMFIETLRRRGYRFSSTVNYSRPIATNGFDCTRPIKVNRVDNIFSVADWNREATPPTRPARKNLIAALAIIVAIGVMLLGGFAIYTGLLGSSREQQTFEVRSVERLTNSGRAKRGAISPDGRYLVHVSEDSKGGTSISLRQVSSSVDVPIAGPLASEIVWVDFGPGGESIYYLLLDREKGDTELYRVPTLGGPSVLAAYDVGPVGFAPGGKSIAFVRLYGNESRLIVANPDGTDEIAVATRREPDRFKMEWDPPIWSPDGKSIACPTRLSDAAGFYESMIAVNVENRTEKNLAATRWRSIGQGRWNRDGVILTAAESAVSPRQIWHISTDTGIATRVTQDINEYSGLSLTEDGSRLAAIQEQTLSKITVVPANGEQKQIVAEVGRIEELAWTRDNRIAYISGASGEIWIINSDGSNQRQITSGALAMHGLTVSPDGETIVFSSTRSGRSNLWQVRNDGSRLLQIMAGESELFPQFSADGRWILFQSGELEPELWRMPANGGDAIRLTEKIGARPSVSHDGKLVAYRYLDSSFERSRWSIGVVPIEGGPQTIRFDFPPTVSERYIRFTPDGRSIAFPSNVNGSSDIWTQSLAGGFPKRLTSFESPNIIAFGWSHDGKNLAIITSLTTHDVVMMSAETRIK